MYVNVVHGHDFGSSNFVNFGVTIGVTSFATTTIAYSLCSRFPHDPSLSFGLFTFHAS
ncbi:hypothetical protein Lalb_Chr25g0286971 [Lupinus albus]|uniref:Uncharacterized protein n=1 Tax=Lupinus albus TaxID=3870 RepID=A0A6A4NF09_LUPAL|nr:hypothetical protein Lalb_Chr25g0286971 [Lupinus albus]